MKRPLPNRRVRDLASRPPPQRWSWRVVRWSCLTLFGFYTLCFVGLLYLKWLPPLLTTVHIQRRVEAVLTLTSYSKRYRFVPLSEISPHLAHAAIASEDARFFEHRGIDWDELETIFDRAQRAGRFLRGGSTITQQLVKNLFLTTHRSFVRKALEFAVTPVTEMVLNKKRILELYLNVVEWGPGVYGAEAAAQFHYGIPAQRLTRDQAARLVACLPAPLERRPQEMDERAADISARMQDMGW